MCGRYGRRGDKQKIAEAFHIGTPLEQVDLEPDQDAAPGSIQPVIHLNQHGERDINLMRWGFKLPQRLLFNTRADTAASSRFWKPKFETIRCIIPASAFFEWQGEKSHKTKYEVTLPQLPWFGMAGLWSPWKNPKTEKWEDTFSIFTSDPNSTMIAVHDRQPVILQPHEYTEWLSPTDRPPTHLLRVFPDTHMKMVPVEGEPKPAIRGLFG